MKIYLLFFVLASVCSQKGITNNPAVKPSNQTSNATGSANATFGQFPVRCQRSVLSSYGLVGLDVASNATIEMCPRIDRTCCDPRDQLIFYRNYRLGGEALEVRTRYQNLNSVYNNLVCSLGKVYTAAEQLLEKVRRKKATNCGLIASKVMAYDIGGISNKIQENLLRMKDFFKTSYDGFYCSLCDADNHMFINTTQKNVVFSAQFCRQMVDQTLPVLLLFHVQIVKYLNLVAKFLVSCSYTGDYRVGQEAPPGLLFTVDRAVQRQLYACRDNRNSVEWLRVCSPICSNFKISEFSTFFEPNVDRIANFTTFINNQLRIFNADVPAMPKALPAAPAAPAPASNASAATGSQPRTTRRLRLLFELENKRGLLFSPLPGTTSSLVGFNSTFDTFGISMFEQGKSSAISSAVYSEVAVELSLNDNSTSARNNTGRNLKGVGLAHAGFILLIAVIFG